MMIKSRINSYKYIYNIFFIYISGQIFLFLSVAGENVDKIDVFFNKQETSNLQIIKLYIYI